MKRNGVVLTPRTMRMAAAAAVFVLLSGFGGPRFGCGGTREERFDRGATFVMDRIDGQLDDLDATDAQRARARQLAERLISDARPVMLSNADAHRDVATQFMADRVDTQKLHALVDARADAYRALAHQAVDAAAELHGMLTPEQKAELRAKLQERLDAMEP